MTTDNNDQLADGVKRCRDCGAEIRLVVSGITNHRGNLRTSNGTYTARVVLSCDCNTECAKATDLDSIKFNGNPPGEWE